MELTLPPRTDGGAGATVAAAPGSPLLILGANGAGKSRFTRNVIDRLGPKALRLSALGALYTNARVLGDAADEASLLRRFSSAVAATQEARSGNTTLLDLLLRQLMHDELLNLLQYKLHLADGNADAALKRTRLDRVIELWQEVFPDNRVLVDSGKMLFTRNSDESGYSALRLSDGERAVLYYAGAVLYAPRGSAIFVDAPEMFLNPTVMTSLWNRLEALRADCTFVYTTHDAEFASGRSGASYIWVRDCDPAAERWEYQLLPQNSEIPDELYITLTGSRKPLIFIEGLPRSIDARLYPLIFPDYNVRSLGSCNKVIEATRTFNDLAGYHKLDTLGIVDRDRRNDDEVAYLRRKRVMVPDVAEIENMFLLPEVMGAMARRAGKDPARVVGKVKRAIMHLFAAELENQALMHTRHKMKRLAEYRIDARFDSIDRLENHIADLVNEMAPRREYASFCDRFRALISRNDYAGVLRVFNMKSMLASSNIAPLCGFKNKDEYISGVIAALRTDTPEAAAIRTAVRECLKA